MGKARGRHRGWTFDPELLYFGAMFHDVGFDGEASQPRRIRVREVDVERECRARISPPTQRRGASDRSGVGCHRTAYDLQVKPLAQAARGGTGDRGGRTGRDGARIRRGAGRNGRRPGPGGRTHVRILSPRSFRPLADGFRHKPGSTFGTVNADVLAQTQPGFQRQDFCALIAASRFQD